jgi:hypothetical protein
MTWINSNTSPSATILTIADFNDLEVFSNSHRTTYNMVDEENLFVGVAWVTASDFCLVNHVFTWLIYVHFYQRNQQQHLDGYFFATAPKFFLYAGQKLLV